MISSLAYLEHRALRQDGARADRRRADERRPVRIARAAFDSRRVEPEPAPHQLGEHRLVALAARPCDVVQNELAVAVEADRRLVLGDAAAAGRLEEQGAADAAELSAPRRLGAARRKAVPVARAFRALDEAREVMAVEYGAGRRLVGDVGLGHRVAPPDLPRIELQRGRGLVHQALDDKRRLRPAGAAIGVGRRGVGHHLQVPAIDRVDAVGAAGHGEAVHRIGEHAGLAEICAGIAQPIGPERQELAAGVERQLARHADGASVIVGQKILLAARLPFDRAAEALREMQQQRMLGIGRGARAERAADIDHVDAHLIRGHAHHHRECVAHRWAALVAAPDLVLVRSGVVGRQRAARLHRVGRDARAFDGDADFLAART